MIQFTPTVPTHLPSGRPLASGRRVTSAPAGRVALFLDLENIRYSLMNEHYSAFDAADLMRRAAAYGTVAVAQAHADFGHQPSTLRTDLAAAGIGESQVALIGTEKRHKSVADNKLTIDAIELLYRDDGVDTYVIASGDVNFLPLAQRLRAAGKRVVVIGVPDCLSAALANAADDVEYVAMVHPSLADDMTADDRRLVRFLLWMDSRWGERSFGGVCAYLSTPSSPTGVPLSGEAARTVINSYLAGDLLRSVPVEGDGPRRHILTVNTDHPWVRTVIAEGFNTGRPRRRSNGAIRRDGMAPPQAVTVAMEAALAVA